MTCKEGELYSRLTSWPDEEDVGSSDGNHRYRLYHFFLQAAFSWWPQAGLSSPLHAVEKGPYKEGLGLGFPTSLEEDLPLCSSQRCCFLSCPCSYCGFAAVVLLPHHFSGHSLMALLLLLLVSEYYCDQTSRKILDLGCWCLQCAPVLFWVESSHTMSVPGVPDGDIPRLYQNAR